MTDEGWGGKAEQFSLTVCHAVEPVVPAVDPEEGHPPGEGGVPRQSIQTEPLVDPDIGPQLKYTCNIDSGNTRHELTLESVWKSESYISIYIHF